MRKIFICLIGAIILSNVQIGCREGNTQVNPNSYETAAFKSVGGGDVQVHRITLDGMEYAIIYEFAGYRGTMTAVNLTRDKLQCEIITKNLKSIKNGTSND